jgi:hypothetical protein
MNAEIVNGRSKDSARYRDGLPSVRRGFRDPSLACSRNGSRSTVKVPKLRQRVQRRIEEIRVLKISFIAGLLVRNRLQARREGFVPFRCE